VPKLTIKTPHPWQVYIELDGQVACVPLGQDNESYAIETDGPIYVTLHGRRVQLQSGNDGWERMRAEVGDDY
jgi:hypothetical protein